MHAYTLYVQFVVLLITSIILGSFLSTSPSVGSTRNSDPGSLSRLLALTPPPPHYDTHLHFYREKRVQPLSSLVDSHRIASTHHATPNSRRSQHLIPFRFVLQNSDPRGRDSNPRTNSSMYHSRVTATTPLLHCTTDAVETKEIETYRNIVQLIILMLANNA